ncbi:DUF3592 domain-containing protein [bacterium]|nr:DUF3592 domain-containing protein [bacterium]
MKKYKNQIIALCICAVLFVVGTIIFFSYDSINNKESVTGTITKIADGCLDEEEGSCTVYFEYEVDDKNYNGEVSKYKEEYKVGGDIHLYYDAENPLSVGVSNKPLYLYIILGVCGVALIGSAVVLIISITSNKKDII